MPNFENPRLEFLPLVADIDALDSGTLLVPVPEYLSPRDSGYPACGIQVEDVQGVIEL